MDGKFTLQITKLLVWLAVGLAGAEAAAQAKVTADVFLYAPAVVKSVDIWSSRSAERIVCQINELDDQKIVFIEGEKPREIPSDRVTKVIPNWRTPAAAAAHQLFVDRNYRAAKDAISKAVTNDLPRWQQRLLVAEFVDVFAALGEYRLAGGVYLKSLAPNQPPAMLLSQLPMNWTTIEPDRPLYESAVEWLSSEDPIAQLLGASWLLLGPDRDAARATLTKLQKSDRETIAALATAQTWRLTPPLETSEKVTEWFAFRDKLIEPLQIGPTEFIAERCARTGMIDLAIGQWSRVATLHSDRPHREAAALNAAARTLTQQGRTEEAKRFQNWAEEFKAQ